MLTSLTLSNTSKTQGYKCYKYDRKLIILTLFTAAIPASTWTTVATLPASCKPICEVNGACVNSAVSGIGMFQIAVDGKINVFSSLSNNAFNLTVAFFIK